MILRELHLVNFRNYSDLSIQLSPGVNCFTGPNGAGKTNILDAIHYLSFCKSFLQLTDTQNIRFGEDFFIIEGTYDGQDAGEKIFCGIKKNQKKQFLRNKSEYEKLADHIGLIPLVLIAPQDSELLLGGGEERRKFLDSVIAQFDRLYLEDLVTYNRILAQRNAALKSMNGVPGADQGMLEVLDEQMMIPGRRIYEKRCAFLDQFRPLLADAYRAVSGGIETAAAEFSSRLDEFSFPELLKLQRERDIRLQYTSQGIHRDDVELLLDGRSAKKFASQGQQKSLLIALRIAQYRFIRKGTGKTPILLLDDISAKLDDRRLKQLMLLVNEESFGQIFVTDTHPERVKELFREEPGMLTVFKVEKGMIETGEHVGA
ncbi:MAG: DNA replication/repair protein RecF [Bacteroidia bacterium]|nr:DNA replication/repair protein RecF [Bacteroidia bacterium]